MENINVFRGIFSSWVFVAVMITTVAFQIVIVELLGTFADTVPLSWLLWLASILLGAGSLLVAVVIKCIPVPVEMTSRSSENHDDYQPLPTGPDLA